MFRTTLLTAAFFIITPSLAYAGPEAFTDGPVIKGFAKTAPVPEAAKVSPETKFKLAFDVAKRAEEGKTNRYMESAGRFINMHTKAGHPLENIEIVVVIHGKAAMDLVTDERYGGTNANAPLIKQLVEAGVRFELCGQTAAYYDIAASDLLEGVDLSLSAMTSHALLQQQGFTLNPF